MTYKNPFCSLPVLITFFTVACLFSCQSLQKQNEAAYKELAFVKQSVEHQINSQMDIIAVQLAGFASVVAGDREFSMKLLVEKDKSAPEVTEIAQRYLAPMALSVLSITDSQYSILSCGHFPANAGSAFESARLLGDKPAFIMDNVKGEAVLTLQSKAQFKILDAVFYACGGMAVGKDFLARLTCWPGYSILIKQGTTVLGMEKIESISDIKDSTILLNNVRYPAASIVLPFAGAGDAPQCVIMSTKPCL
jgi:hypothetical protein